MNIAQSMIYVLKHRKGEIFQSFWKQDLRPVYRGIKKETKSFYRKSKNNGVKITLSEIKNSTVESVAVFKDLPGRIRQGLLYFHDDLLKELDAQSDPKNKTVLCLKVIALLCSYTLGSVHGIRQSGHQLNFKGLRLKSTVIQIIATEILIKVSQVFILRLLEEVEGQLDDPEEKKKISSLRNVISLGQGNALDQENNAVEKNDRAHRIVESFRVYLMTGVREEP